MTSKTQFLILFLIVIGGVAAYAGATNTISIGDGNSTIVDNTTGNVTVNTTEDVPIVADEANNTSVLPDNNATPGTTTSASNASNPTVINNNNYINVNNNIQVPASVQPSITPTQTTTDTALQKTQVVEKKTVTAPKVVQQKTVTIKTTDLYTGQIVKLTNAEEVKKGLEITEVNTGKTGCEYIVLTNNNDFDMGLGGYTIYIDETETGIRLPNIEIGAGKSVKMFTVNGKADTFDKDGDLQKFHFRLAKELYPDDTPVNIYLLEPNFNEAISQIETKA
ncbi:MAG: hypothetical protein PHN69_07385 [Candidatus Pacebacteria bacterium]|nr:hypothetical protein [Candidatus Paceibacterota bacterium]